jgi:hypothetical protein
MAVEERRTSLRFSRVKIEESSQQGSGQLATKSSSVSSSSRTAKDDFDVFLYLNGADQTSYSNLRDPVLRKMTVSKYEGDLDSSGYFHGTGKMVSTLGYTYTGQFQKGLMHGKGKIEWVNGLSYDGTWEDNIISGSGRYQWPTGDWYEGQVKKSVRHGKGKFFYAALDETYTGEWVNGLREGAGTLDYGGGSTYVGRWKNDRKCGSGIMTYAGKDTYDGEWLDDQRHGLGTMKWYNQNNLLVEVYAGNWVQGVQHGQGVVTYIRPPFPHPPPSGDAASAKQPESLRPKDSAVNTYDGEFFIAKRHGFGTMVYDDGSRYEGMWDDNQKHGQGKYTSAIGAVTIGQFDRGTALTDLGVADPLTGATPPLPLYIRDILGVHENNVAESVIAVQSIVSRYNGLLKKVFSFYATLDTVVLALPQPAKQERTQGTISVAQFVRLLTDAKLINRDMTIAVVNRLLCSFSDNVRAATSMGVSPLDGNVNLVDAGPHAGGSLTTDGSAVLRKNSAVTNSAQSATITPKTNTSLSSSPSSTSGTYPPAGRAYTRRWDQFRSALYLFTGELNFREFVEAIVRVASVYYAEDLWGPLATKVLVVLEDHLEPLPCATGSPILFPRTKDSLSVLQPHITSLTQVFIHHADQTSLGFRNAAVMTAAAPPSPTSAAAAAVEMSKRTLAGVTIKFRQFALMLRAGGFFDAEKCTTVVLPKILKWDRFASNTTAIYFKRVIIPATTNPASRPVSERCTSAIGDGTVSERGSLAASEGMRSSQTTHTQQSTTVVSTDKYERPILSEAALRSRWAMKQRSKGLGNGNAHATLNMELELTFPEFVEILCEAANVKYASLPWEQRVSTLIKEVMVPQFKRLC